MSQANFIHLNLHTEYSLVDSVVRIDPLIEACAKEGMPAVAMTDRMNLFGLVKFYKACIGVGIKPIMGAEIIMPQGARAILLCRNKVGYHNVTRLISRSYLERKGVEEPTVLPEWFDEPGLCEGILMLSGAQYGDIGRQILSGNLDDAKALLQTWLKRFPDAYYFEIQRVGHAGEENYIQTALSLAEEFDVPVVATNAVRFIHESDFAAHETRVCIREGVTLNDKRRAQEYTPQQYLRSPEDMTNIFKDIPEAIENSVEIYKRCNMELKLGDSYLPNFPIPDGIGLDDYFAQKSQAGLNERLPTHSKEYEERLQFELKVIRSMGFSGYFLIVADFIEWSKKNDIPVGPGRGSGAGSLVAYSLKITDLDPIFHGLLFERFLNPERVSMPDFDIDFCMDGRDRVIEYVSQKYGREAVSQIITYGTMAAKAVVRDVGRALGHPYGFVDKIAKMIPFELGITLNKALEQEDQLQERYNKEDEVKELIDLALKLEGLTRNVGRHAGGVVIAPSRLTDFTPIYIESEGAGLVSQFDKDDVEAVGLVKFDFLGLRTLTIINSAVKAIKKHKNPRLDINLLPLDDKKTFDLLKDCNTTAVFQLESRGMKDLVKRLQPESFTDVVALLALFRPGPLESGMVDDFVERRHGRSKVYYEHPALESILQETYGVILYQEQVMQIAQVLGGYSLGGADLLRRAMGKKKPEEMAKQRALFVAGATKNHVEGRTATHIFDLMEKFAGYGFNKSHSAAYALISYQTAWLKAHYPAELMAAVLSSDMDNTEKVVLFYEDTLKQGCKVLPPNINTDFYAFTVNENNDILYGLGAVKGVGQSAVEMIVAEREANGQFLDLFEFCLRIDVKKANRRALDALIKSGAMDVFGQDRNVLLASLANALQAAEHSSRNEAVGQADLFAAENLETRANPEYAKVPPYTEKERLEAERETLGLFLSGHPLEFYKDELNQLVNCKIKDFTLSSNRSLKIAGIVTNVRTVLTRRGDRMAIVTMDDHTGSTEIAVFSELYFSNRELLQKDNILMIEGDVGLDRFTGQYKFNTKNILSLDQARAAYAKGLLITLDSSTIDPSLMEKLQAILKTYLGGTCLVAIDYQKDGATARIKLGPNWKVRLNDDLLKDLRAMFGLDRVGVVY